MTTRLKQTSQIKWTLDDLAGVAPEPSRDTPPGTRVYGSPEQSVDVMEHGRKRDEDRVLVRVDVIPQNGAAIGCRHVPQGVTFCDLYKKELDEARALVVPEKHWREAEAAYETYLRKLTEWVESGPRNETGLPENDPAAYHRSPQMEAHEMGFAWALGKIGFGKLRSLEVICDVPRIETPEGKVREEREAATSDTVRAIHELAKALPEGVAAALATVLAAQQPAPKGR